MKNIEYKALLILTLVIIAFALVERYFNLSVIILAITFIYMLFLVIKYHLTIEDLKHLL